MPDQRAPVGILLAAGRGKRFDPEQKGRNKLMAKLPGASLSIVEAAAASLQSACARVVAVVRADDAVAQCLRAQGCEVLLCLRADEGMAASLKHALAHTAEAGAWLIALGDMPFVRPHTNQVLAVALTAGAAIVAPVCQGRRGNPVGFNKMHFAALMALTGDQGARAIVAANAVTDILVDDLGIFRDIDTEESLTLCA